jgi:predicted 3-demethylubiquinone-9 3-methyltransferase (glyoxalase superfamily)
MTGQPIEQSEDRLMTSITTCLWFDGVAEEAARFYTSVFPNSRIERVMASPADAPDVPKGSTVTVEFTLDGRPFIGLNGGPGHPFTDAISLSIDCADQAEVDRYWNALIGNGGQPGPCGWLTDRFGVAWQVVPRQLIEMMSSSDRDAAARAMEAMLTMSKIDVARIREAFEGVPA